MSDTAAKARALRLERLRTMLSGRLDNPAAAIEALMSELHLGERQPELWERLHAAASDGKEQDLAAAYRKVATGRRLKQLPPPIQAEVLVHAANFFQGILGDASSAEAFLFSALSVYPDQREIFERLERKLQAAGDRRRLAELYATVAAGPPKPPGELAGKAVNAIVPLTAKTPLSDDACRSLVPLIASGPSLLDAIEAHCRKTSRPALACAVIELALVAGGLPESSAVDWERRLIDLYIGEAEQPEKAIAHVEALLLRDPNDSQVRAAVKRLLAVRELSDRVTAVLQDVRRQSRKE